MSVQGNQLSRCLITPVFLQLLQIARKYNGSTADAGAACPGSNPVRLIFIYSAIGGRAFISFVFNAYGMLTLLYILY